MILQQLCQNSRYQKFILKFKWLDKFYDLNCGKKQEDKTADYEMLFTVCVLNTLVPTTKSKPLGRT
jgi:hypothetical protein